MTTSLPPPAPHQPPLPSIPPSSPQGASRQRGPQPAAPGWFPDPFGRHQFRYADATGWTYTVCDNGVVTIEGTPVAGPAPRPRRRRWWIIVGIVTACVVGVGVLGVGLDAAMHTLDTYTADLTKGSGDFPTTDNPGLWATMYRADGYYMVAQSPGFVMSGVTADASHTVVAAKVTVQARMAPLDAAFGPFVLADAKGAGYWPGAGYWLSVDSTGTATLNEIDAKGDVGVVASALAPPLDTGTTRTLMLTCSIDPDGTTRLGGYVDGTRVISGAPTVKISSVTVTGMAGHAKTDVPAAWVATRFARLGPDDMPKDAPK
ncbi:MAG: hypothetical protein ACM3ML_10425 [Micromonosporaceae bacterium]